MASDAAMKGNLEETNWTEVRPQVNAEAEFLEIASDFGNPLEIVREAISNSIDAGARSIGIVFSVEEVDGAQTLVISIDDDGSGMTREVLERDFWGLGYSSRSLSLPIGS